MTRPERSEGLSKDEPCPLTDEEILHLTAPCPGPWSEIKAIARAAYAKGLAAGRVKGLSKAYDILEADWGKDCEIIGEDIVAAAEAARGDDPIYADIIEGAEAILKGSSEGEIVAATCPVPIECEHGFDTCPVCDGSADDV